MRRLLLVLAACGGGSSAPPGVDASVDATAAPDAYVDPSAPFFEPDHIVEVSITMAPADWNAMRVQTRTIGSVIEGHCLAQPALDPFTDFQAQVTIDGTTLPQVGIHKKGFFGSLDSTKPSLKLTLDQVVANQEYLGLKKITLNNSHQDPAYVRQCLAYETFAAAGIVVPRCNFAHVHVNGTDMGVYVNVETIDKRLIKKRYTDATGTLYEGTLSDFRTNWIGTFDPKAGSGSSADLQPLADVLETASDTTLPAALAPYLDLDRFMTFWAMEVITNHWDGYDNDHNNFFVYKDPSTGKLDFIPWGPDATFQPGVTFGAIGSTNGPVAVTANGILPNRLFAIPAQRQQFLDKERSLLAGVFDETYALARIDHMEGLIAPIADPVQGTAWHTDLAAVRQFINGRRTQLTTALDAGPTWTDPLPGYPCLDVKAHVTGTFSTTYGTLGAQNPFTTGSGTMTLTINGVATALTPVGATAGTDAQSGNATIQVFGVRATDNHIIAISMAMPPSRFAPRTADLGFFDASGAVFDFDPATNTGTTIGFMLGSLPLTKASPTSSAQVAGSFDSNADLQGTPP